MTVDLIGPGGAFGKLKLPEIRLAPSGTDFHVDPQTIVITDHDAFQAFVKTIQLDERCSLTLYNPEVSVSAVYMTTTAKFNKKLDIPGMHGPQIKLIKTTSKGRPDGMFMNTIRITNPSPLEIFIPQSTFQYIDELGTVVAEQYGEFNITRGVSEHTLPGKITAGRALGQIKLVGKDVEADSWMKTTIRYFESYVYLTPVLAGMITL